MDFPWLYGLQRYPRNFTRTALFQACSGIPGVNQTVDILFNVVLKVLKRSLEAIPDVFIVLGLTGVLPVDVHYLDIILLVHR